MGWLANTPWRLVSFHGTLRATSNVVIESSHVPKVHGSHGLKWTLVDVPPLMGSAMVVESEQ